MQGVSEEAVRAFVRNTAMPDWEEFFESLFGYHAKLAARPLGARAQGPLPEAARPLARLGDALGRGRARERRDERETELFRSIEVRALVASGTNLLTARRKSQRVAEATVAVASDARAAVRRPHARPAATGADRSWVAAIRKAAESAEEILAGREHGLIGARTWWIIDVLTGARLRFLLARPWSPGAWGGSTRTGSSRPTRSRTSARR